MNEVTPRIFVAGTQQNDGKTTTCMGLISVLKHRYERIGFIKPVGQRTVEVDGKSIDEDTVLVDDTYGLHTPLEAMSPVTVDSDFTRRYVKNANPDFFMKRIQNSFDRAVPGEIGGAGLSIPVGGAETSANTAFRPSTSTTTSSSAANGAPVRLCIEL